MRADTLTSSGGAVAKAIVSALEDGDDLCGQPSAEPSR